MPWVQGVPIDHGADVDRPQAVSFAVLHRTVGSWPGDFSVGKNRRHSSPGTFNLLVGEREGQWVQFYPSDTRASHAAGGNDGPGVEFSGQNGAPLTDWQIRAGGHILRELAKMHGIPLTLHDEPRRQIDDSGFRGFVNHRGIETSPQWRHFDYVTQAEFARMTQGATPAPPPPPVAKDIDMASVATFEFKDAAGKPRLQQVGVDMLGNLIDVGSIATPKPGQPGNWQQAVIAGPSATGAKQTKDAAMAHLDPGVLLDFGGTKGRIDVSVWHHDGRRIIHAVLVPGGAWESEVTP